MTSDELKELLTEYIEITKNNLEIFAKHSKLFPKADPKFKTKAWTEKGKEKVAMTYESSTGKRYKNKSKIKNKTYRNVTLQRGSKNSGYLSSGNLAPYIAILNENHKQTVNNGIYPFYYYDLNDDVLLLKYGKSNAKIPNPTWTFSKTGEKLDDRIYKKYYNASTSYKSWDFDQMLSDLDDMIDDYEIALGIDRTKRADGTEGSGTGYVLAAGEAGLGGEKKDGDPKKGGVDDKNPSHPLNLILYGPPGTGKTYNTLFKALEIIEGKTKEDLENEIEVQDEKKKTDPDKEKSGYQVLKDRYDHYVETGQIVFTTFHQSMSYEDFIEGIKPNVEGDEMTYEVQDGIFKKLCKSASNEYYDVDFDKCYNDFVSKLGGRLKLKSSGGKEFYVDLNSKGNLNLYTTSKQNFNGVLTKEKIKQTLLGKEDYWKGYMMGVINHLKKKYGLKDPQKVDEQRNYVLIIDEINRGNVAQIFGELITLIEPSKRLDNSEEMKAILPYSSAQKGEPEYFGVPNNLYIIGTMNTADRSVEALDTALRRRFSFEEMMPDKSLLTGVCGVDLGLLLETINKRIVALKDREHQIGHSYFMGHDDKNEDGSDKYPNKEEWLTNVFKDKIIPLLQEYFYGDYKKIYYVLGPGFVEKKTEKTIFAVENPDYDEFDIPEERYDIASFDAKFNIKDAIEKMKVQKLDSGTGTMSTEATTIETGATAESEESTDKE